MKTLLRTVKLSILILGISAKTALAYQSTQTLPMHQVYQRQTVFPDFQERDKDFSHYRTRIVEEMKTGPNFAGHYAIIIIGCGTACRFAFIGDLANGQLYQFPYGGEENYDMNLHFNVKSNEVDVRWITGDNCMKDSLIWNGFEFKSLTLRRLGNRNFCEAM